MWRPALARVLLLATVAGVAAGLVAALFNAVLTEPIIDRAIALEEAAAAEAADAHSDDEGAHDHGGAVSRDGQRMGLWLGWIGLGVVWGVVVGSLYFLGWRFLPHAGSHWWRLVAAAAAWFTLGLLPFVKYPANPPAVGDPETINDRMASFVGLEVVTAILCISAIAFAVLLMRRGVQMRAVVPTGLAVLAAGAAALYFVFPAAEPDLAHGELAAVIEEFRRHAFAGQLVFWAAFAFAFALLPGWPSFRLHREDGGKVQPALVESEAAR